MDIKHILENLNSLNNNKVKFAVTDIDGVLRGKTIHIDKFKETIKGTIGFCDVIFGWDVNDVCYTNTKFTGWHTGYPDAEVKIDLSTFRQIPWDNKTPFFIGDLQEETPIVCPRSLLRSIVKKSETMGFKPIMSLEYEWFNFKESSSELEAKNYKNPTPITNGMFGYSMLRPAQNADFINSLFNYMEQFNVKIEGMHSETGPGVLEAAVLFDEAVNAADKATLFKAGVKEIANKYGFIATFMAKYNNNLPGCGGHLHQSLWDLSKNNNLFFDDTDDSNMSQIMKNFLAGQLFCLPHILPMYAPTVNSYKRLTKGAWAPTCVSWGIDNRTTAFRVINKNMPSTRIEARVPGADVNPYLAIAASLASGLYGIQNNLSLDIPPVTGNGYDAKSELFASNLGDATAIMKHSKVAESLFGKPFVEHFTLTREWEWEQFNKKVTDWELNRYFEII